MIDLVFGVAVTTALLAQREALAETPASSAAQERPSEPSRQPRGAEPGDASAPSASLVVRGLSDGMRVIVLKDEPLAAGGARAAWCHQDCELRLPTGAYTLVASQGERQSRQNVDLAAPLHLTVTEPNTALRNFGSFLGVVGIGIASVGTLFLVGTLLAPSPAPGADEYTERRMSIMLFGFLGMAGGGGLAAGGFSIAAANGAPSMETSRGAPPGPPRGPTGAGISLIRKF
jgi:hypothetical protein